MRTRRPRSQVQPARDVPICGRDVRVPRFKRHETCLYADETSAFPGSTGTRRAYMRTRRPRFQVQPARDVPICGRDVRVPRFKRHETCLYADETSAFPGSTGTRRAYMRTRRPRSQVQPARDVPICGRDVRVPRFNRHETCLYADETSAFPGSTGTRRAYMRTRCPRSQGATR